MPRALLSLTVVPEPCCALVQSSHHVGNLGFYLYMEMLGEPVSPGACVLASESIGDW